jgi:hypothetical protein
LRSFDSRFARDDDQVARSKRGKEKDGKRRKKLRVASWVQYSFWMCGERYGADNQVDQVLVFI